MNTDKMFPSKYLKAVDAEPELTLTVDTIKQEPVVNKEGESEDKWVLYFKEVQKGMILNVTNTNTLVGLYGKETDEWIGKRIVLTAPEVTAFGKTAPALRISSKKPVADKKVLVAAYQKLYEKAAKLKIDGLSDFVVTADTPEDALIEAGKQLRALVDAAQAFA
jgi:hypothetical protein